MSELSALFPDLGERLKGAPPSTAVMGGVSASSRVRAVARGRIALVGDASGSVDAVTGSGLSLAFRQALALAAALERDDLGAYRAAHRRIGRMPRLMARLMLAMDGRTWLRHRALRALACRPHTFSRLLAAHTGALPSAPIGLNALTGLAWQLLTAGSPAGHRSE